MRIAVELQHLALPLELILVSRNDSVTAQASLISSLKPLNRSKGSQSLSYLQESSQNKFISSKKLDLFDTSALETFIRQHPPDLIINCASLLSPWFYSQSKIKLWRELGKVGFGAQLCAQLPPILNLMNTLHTAGISSPVINCSFPDVVNHILAKLKLSPLCGIGNAGMLSRVLCTRMPDSDIRLTAHHALTQKLLCCTQTEHLDAYCHIEINGEIQQWSALTRDTPPMMRNAQLNLLTASHATDIVSALLNEKTILKSSIPGPLGMPGGYPCMIDKNGLRLQTCQHISQSEAENLNLNSAKLDGISSIDHDGTVNYTENFQKSLPDVLGFLAEPLHPNSSLQRFTQLEACLNHA